MANELALHSVSYAGLWGQAFLTVEEFISKAAELGYSGVMLMAKRPHLSILDYGPSRRAALRERLEKQQVKPVCLAGYTNFTADLEHSEIPHREFQIQHVAALAELARDVGCPLVRIFTGYEHPASTFSPQWKMVVAAIRECCQRAAEFRVDIGVQNHHDLAVGFESHADMITGYRRIELQGAFRRVGSGTARCGYCGRGTEARPMTTHTTVANYVLRPRYKYDSALVNYTPQLPAIQAVPMQDGFIDYRGFLAALRGAGFTGSIAYEMCSQLRDGGDLKTLDSYARQFLEYMAT